jgi:polysaccharide export outer membrane protein
MKRLLAFSLILPFLVSCGKPLRDLSYFKAGDKGSIQVPKYREPVITKGDILSIVISSDNPRASELFNLPNYQPSNIQVGTPSLTTGYLVNEQGNIQVYQLGDVKADSLTKFELTNVLKEKLTTYLQNPIVNIRLLNFKVTVLGEVNRPGSFSIPNEKVNVLEALGLAGDLTLFGERKTVTLIRTSGETTDFVKLDLTSKDLLSSQYFHLKQNDILYVDVNPRKVNNQDQTTARTVGIVTGVISSIAFLVTIIRN